jgi:hypothetical protein
MQEIERHRHPPILAQSLCRGRPPRHPRRYARPPTWRPGSPQESFNRLDQGVPEHGMLVLIQVDAVDPAARRHGARVEEGEAVDAM